MPDNVGHNTLDSFMDPIVPEQVRDDSRLQDDKHIHLQPLTPQSEPASDPIPQSYSSPRYSTAKISVAPPGIGPAPRLP